ncbi:DUF349 domain-containing protein [Gordonia sp. HNM0687]|uniref:DUF349 domain-containing protein n=1 Tax=Gordonia mangrovi TaxID=2665643 RepID=A0A6L7GUM7_9ACTN|nr:DUF349 domain-containing protein [Gordonia mangrovi]MXP22375.1 DUF349 domain-containing protein [Gordonia mangrovi]UVF77737.1 DUF349 domain-containing protein [Gordonia mangrovi]
MTDQTDPPAASGSGAAAPGAPDAGTPTPNPGPPKPHPMPKPGPRPGPRPRAAEVHPVPTPVPGGDPHEFGRIDAEGAVWLKTAGGERQIGSWQAGSVEEGLAHFSRKFDDLATEVEILEERLAARSGDPRKAQTAARHLLDALPTAAVIGDVAALEQRLTVIVGSADEVADSIKAEREHMRAAAIARKETLAVEAEQIGAESTQWKVAGDRLRAILDEWKTIKGVDRKTDDALWKRYAKARDAFNRRRGAHFAELDRERAGAKARKEELIARAEELSTSTDWGPTSAQFRELLTEWKAAGRAPRDADDALWQRFKAAQDVFFSARNAATSERDSEFAANAAAKVALLEQAEKKVDPAADLDAARREFRAFRDQWDEIGKVPRDQMSSLEGRARALEKRIRDAEETQWQRTDPEAQARAAQFADRAAQLEDQARKADDRGKAKDAAKLREQAAQWREWADAAASAIADR